MPIDPLSAANAYRNQMKMAEQAGDGAADAQNNAGAPSFAQMVENVARDAASAQYNAEAVQTQSLTGGNVELSDLVTAVSNAELSLNTVVAIRDRVINAYNDIIKMSI